MRTHPGRIIRHLCLPALAFSVLLSSARTEADVPDYAPRSILVRINDAPPRIAPGVNVFKRFNLVEHETIVPRSVPGKLSREAIDGWTEYRISDGADPAAISDSLTSYGFTAQPNYLYQLLEAPNDEHWPDQWAVESIGLEAVWQDIQARSRDSVLVAIIDSGIDYNHPDLTGRIWANLAEVNGMPGVDDDGNGYIDDTRGWDFTDAPDLAGTGDYLVRDNDPYDTNGHGTFVSGAIAAKINNEVGIAGAAPTARIMPLRAGADLAFGGAFLEEDDIASAVVYAVENGARVINMSFGDEVSTPLMHDMVAYALNAGVVVVASAGNNRTAQLLYPAAYDETIAVGAIDKQNAPSHFTSWGENLDLVAPGSDVITTNPGGYQYVWGTSISGPYVVAACANLLALAPELSPQQVRDMIRAGTIDLGDEGWDPQFGFGRLHLPTLFGVTSSPSAEILSPDRPDGADADVAWEAVVGGTPPAAWELTFGIGTEPAIWTSAARGVLTAPSDSIAGSITTAALPETTYTLRLTMSDALGNHREDRTILTVDHSAPVFSESPTAHVRWLGAEPFTAIEWTTDDLTTGEMIVESPAGSGVETRIPLGIETTEHTAVPPDHLLDSGVSVRVLGTNRAGLSTQSETIDVAALPPSVPTSGFVRIGAMPLGALMPVTSDFDGDGVPELAVTPSSRSAYDTVSFYEVSPSGAAYLAFESVEAMRPSATADLDEDGLLELIGIEHSGDAFRVKVVEQETSGGVPTALVWQGNEMLAPTVGDVDQDGVPDLLTLTEPDRTALGMYEAVNSDASLLTQVGTIGDWEDDAAERFGIWRAVGDFDGDGITEVAVGTESGTVVVYERTGDNTFTRTRTIEGDGNATRVWGGIDVTGDGIDDFAVLRFQDDDAYNIGERRYVLEVYSDGTEPVFVREFADPRTDGNGFAAGPVGPNGGNALVLSFPPRIYVVSPQGGGSLGITWFATTTAPSQPVIANVDGISGVELVYAAEDSTSIMRTTVASDAPAAPRDVEVAVGDSISVEVSWYAESGLTYRIWTGDSPEAIAPLSAADPQPPFTIGNLSQDTPVSVAVQAVNPGIADSLGAISDVVTVTPHAGPFITSASFVDEARISVSFSSPLSNAATSLGSFELNAGGEQYFPASIILAHSGRLLILSLPKDLHGVDGIELSATIEDTAGAKRLTAVDVQREMVTPNGALSYAISTRATRIAIGFPFNVDPTTISPTTVSLIGGPTVNGVTQVDGSLRDFEVWLNDPIGEDGPAILRVAGAQSATGDVFSAAAVLSNEYLSSDSEVEVVGVLQIAPDTLWVVTTLALDVAAMETNDVLITPRTTVRSISVGPTPQVMEVVLDPNTPVGPWQDEYRLLISYPSSSRGISVLDVTFTPVSNSVLTGRLLEASYVDATTISLAFDTTIAPLSKQPESAIRIEPDIVLDSYVVADSIVTLHLNDRTRLGPWGFTYYVHVEGLLVADGTPLSELAAIQLDAVEDFSAFTVFPQPYRPAEDGDLVFGGLPSNAEIRLYSLSGALVRTFEYDGSGGVSWNGTNDAGERVRSGIYLYVVDSVGRKHTGKIAVVR